MDSNTDITDIFCINCKHIATNASGDGDKYRCMAPQNQRGLHLVTGYKLYRVEFCSDARYASHLGENICGLKAAWFEQAPPKTAPAVTTTQPITTTKSIRISSRNDDLLRDLGI